MSMGPIVSRTVASRVVFAARCLQRAAKAGRRGRARDEAAQAGRWTRMRRRARLRARVRGDPGRRPRQGQPHDGHGLRPGRIILVSLLIASRRLPRLQQPRVLTRQSEPRRRLWSCARITPRRGSGMRRGTQNRGAQNRRLARLQARGIIARREHLRAHGPAAAQDPPVGGGAHRTDRPDAVDRKSVV